MQQGIISVKGLSFTYPGSNSPLLKDIDLEVEAGDFVAVIGSNGSGKTTFCKALNGLIPQYITGDFAGTVEVLGHNTLETPVASLARHIAYVYQDFENQLVRSTVYQDVIFAPLNFGLADYRQRGLRALEILGLEQIKNKFIWELSGGQKHLTALAGALSLEPEIIIVDEPAAQLDPVNAVLVYEKLKMLNRDYGKTIIVIEHNTEFIADYCHTVIMMEQGRIFWQKPVREALNRLEELMERNIHPPQVTQAAGILDRISSIDQESSISNISNIPNIPKGYPIQLTESKAYFAAQKPLYNTSTLLAKHAADRISEKKDRVPAIRFQGVTQGYKTLENTTHEILRNIDLTIHEGDRLALVGSNGAGKSTLIKLISGIVKPLNGRVTVYDLDTQLASPEKLAEKVTYIFQNPEEMFIEDSVRKDVEYFYKARRHPELDKLVDQVIHGLQLTELQHQNGRLLSGGQQRRASLAIGVATYPSIILLDEPTGSLDISSRKEMIAMLNYLQDKVKTVVIATHDMQLAAEWANRIVVMKDGSIIEDSDKYTVFGNPDLLAKANLRPPQIVELCRELGISPVAFSLNEFSACLIPQAGEEEERNLGKYHEVI